VEKGGLRDAVVAVGITDGKTVEFSDELRLGLHGRTRRVLAPKGVKVVQQLQLEYHWRYLLVAVAPLTGEIRWAWIERMRQGDLVPALEEWELRCVVWDGAPSHRGKQVQALALARVALPSYSPELNPAARVFEEIRARTEGVVYASLDAKQAVAEAYLRELKADPERVKQLCSWTWLHAALDALPPAKA
jgi:hypothetical protein